MAKQQLSKEMQESILNYANEIKTLATFVEAVRKRPGMYIGRIGNGGFLNMIREILQNSLDEINREYSPANQATISYDERTHQIIVSDNGRGLPFDNIIRILTSQHTSSNFEKKKGDYTSGLNGVGAKIVNALSSEFIVESYVLGEARRVEFKDGIVWDKGELPVPNKEGKQGTFMSFIPSYEIMGNITLSYKDVLHLVQVMVPLCRIGATVHFNAIDMNGNVHRETIVNEDGIMSILINKTTNPLVKPVYMTMDNGTMKAEITFTYDANDLMMEDVTTFSNFCPTVSGTHLDGFLDGVTRFFRDYMNKIYLKQNSKITVVNNDIKTGLKAVVNVSHLDPIFTGQAKEILSNEDMLVFTKNLVMTYLNEWIKTNPNDLQKMCKYFKDIAEVRIKSDEGKVNLTKKYTQSALSGGMPAKYVKPNGKTNLELFIVEGDSALGSARNSRNKQFQGVFPIRGKIPNAFSTERSKFLSNAEIAGILTIIGAGYGKNFNIENCKWDKIILAADADPDGAHIRSLLLRFFLLYCPGLIQAGKLYGAVPPLYGVKVHGKVRYFTEKIDFARYVQQQFSSQSNICNSNGIKLTNNECIDILYRNMDYTAELESIATTFAIDPYLLEICLNSRDLEYKKLKKYLESTYRFIKVSQENGVTLINGLIDSKYQTVTLNDKLLNSCKGLLKYIDNSPKTFILDGNKVSLYGLMKQFDSYKPSNITRFKGLGEMDPKQLAESTLWPDNRMLIRYNIEDVKAEIEAIRFIESNKYELLKDINISKDDVM